MKYQTFSEFRKAKAGRLYLVAVPDDFERSKVFDAVLAQLPAQPTRFSGADCDLRECLDAMQSMSLLGEPVVLIDEVEKLAKKQQQLLCDTLKSSAAILLFGARSKTLLAPIVEKEGIVLDLLEEKPWDKEKRLSFELMERAKNGGKKLAPEATLLLFERLGVDPALLASELDKLICYVGDRPQITREDILHISPASRTSTLWQTAEAVIWEGGEFTEVDNNTVYGLIPAMRSQLHLGLTLATLIAEGCPSDQWSRYLPKLWPKVLEKRSSQAARLGAPYFQKGLEKLFALELASRTHSTQYRALLDLFRAELHAR